MAFSLAGLGAVAGGIDKGLAFGEDLQSKQLQKQAQEALGRAFMGGDGGLGGLGGLNQGAGPQPPSPGQASQPMQQPANQNFGSPSMGAPQAPQGGAPMPGQATPQMMATTAGQESSGNYAAKGPWLTDKSGNSGQALGKYGIMSYNLQPWLAEAKLPPMTPQQFLVSPQVQDALYKHKMGSYVQKYGPEAAGQAWIGGEGSIGHPNRTDPLGTSVGSYGQNFAQGAGVQPGQGQPQQQAPGGQQSSTPQLAQLAQRIKASNPNIKPGVLWQAMAQAAPLMDKESQMAFQQQTALFNEQLKVQTAQIKVLQQQIDNTLKQNRAQTSSDNLSERKAHDAAIENQDADRQTRIEANQKQEQLGRAQEGVRKAIKDYVTYMSANPNASATATPAGAGLLGTGFMAASAKPADPMAKMLLDGVDQAKAALAKMQGGDSSSTASPNAPASSAPKPQDGPRNEDAPPPQPAQTAPMQASKPPPQLLQSIPEGHQRTFNTNPPQIWKKVNGEVSQVK